MQKHARPGCADPGPGAIKPGPCSCECAGAATQISIIVSRARTAAAGRGSRKGHGMRTTNRSAAAQITKTTKTRQASRVDSVVPSRATRLARSETEIRRRTRTKAVLGWLQDEDRLGRRICWDHVFVIASVGNE